MLTVRCDGDPALWYARWVTRKVWAMRPIRIAERELAKLRQRFTHVTAE